jgi:hypothetical protein
MVLIHYNVIDILIVPLNASTVYHILEMFVVGIVFGRLSLFVSIVGSLFPFCWLLYLSVDPRLAISLGCHFVKSTTILMTRLYIIFLIV